MQNNDEEIDTLSKYGSNFQTQVLAAFLTDNKFLDSLSDITSEGHFESDVDKWIMGEITDYHKLYKRPPNLDVFKVKVSQIVDPTMATNVVNQLKVIFKETDKVNLDFIKDEFKSFCINQNLKNVILKSVDLLKAGSYDKIKTLVDEAMKAGVNLDLGHDYVEDFDKRATEELRNAIATDWDPINDLMGGGLGPGELGVVVAPSGVGKTWALVHIGAAAVKAGLQVVHYSMELSEYYVGARYDTVFSNIPSQDLKEKSDNVKEYVDRLKGNLLIKYFPPKGVSANKIRNHIEKMEGAGNKPDLIILDYADLLLSDRVGGDSTYQEQGGVYIELRGMGGELEIPIWTASQTNRSAMESDVIEADKIADSYAKVMNADFIMSWSRKAKDKLNNTARVHVMKNRFGPDGITFPCKMDTNTGFIEVYDGNSDAGLSTTAQTDAGAVDQQQLLKKKYLNTLG